MIEMSLTTIAKAVNAQLLGDDCTVSEVFTDTRNAANDSLFVALIGENFDAHNFVNKAQEQGAKALLVSKSVENSLPQLKVENTEKALADLARFVRRQVNPKVIGITGSAGKTSVKEMVASILKVGNNEAKVLSTAGNFNNHIGVPLTLLRLTNDVEFAVVEMGANHIGEIEYCSSIAEPDVTVVNNVAPAHIEGFGSIEGVAKAKGEIYQALNSDATGVINLDSDFATDYMAMSGFHKVTVSCHNSADFSAHNISVNDDGLASFEMHFDEHSLEINLQVSGMHQVSNALVAAALANQVGATAEQIQQGLQNAEAVQGRLNHFTGINESSLIDDTYNASVASVKVAAEVLSHWQGHKIFVLGDMAELGDLSDSYHAEVGAYIKQQGIDELLTWGNWSESASRAFGAGAKHFESKQELITALQSKANANTQILIKGSRSSRMEQVVEALKADAGQTQDEQNNSLGGGDQC